LNGVSRIGAMAAVAIDKSVLSDDQLHGRRKLKPSVH